mmetsp:Transcript_1922/g.8508  ORF Transcript_1922/g.8508 Transcript_1922/m.8508 type:complete len:205 (-) Transcript_1922:1196-1810(-)|eukprot:scaffold3870_cov246-Pinguiococcus_pyrenoidosus.AAC.12
MRSLPLLHSRQVTDRIGRKGRQELAKGSPSISGHAVTASVQILAVFQIVALRHVLPGFQMPSVSLVLCLAPFLHGVLQASSHVVVENLQEPCQPMGGADGVTEDEDHAAGIAHTVCCAPQHVLVEHTDEATKLLRFAFYMDPGLLQRRRQTVGCALVRNAWCRSRQFSRRPHGEHHWIEEIEMRQLLRVSCHRGGEEHSPQRRS